MRLLLCDCNCSPDRPYMDGSLPEHFEGSEEEAASRFIQLKMEDAAGLVYWGLHWNGRHVLSVHG